MGIAVGEVSLIHSYGRWHANPCAAVAFGYFETLFALRDIGRIQNEIERLKSLNVLLERVGIAEHIYEIFVDTTEDILSRIQAAIQNGNQDETFLVEAFNENYSSDAVITHFRVSISAGASFQFVFGRLVPFSMDVN
jgi:hypothetical protein